MKKLSLFVVILFVFTTLTACGKPADADELLQLGLEAASEVESSTSDFSATISVGGASYEVTGSTEFVATPEAAIKCTLNILDTTVTLTYTGGTFYVESKSVELSEAQKASLDETLTKDVSYDTLITYIQADSLNFVENDGSYTLSLNLDPELSKDFVVEKLNSILTEEQLAQIAGTEVNTDTISIGEISFEFELDEKDFNVMSSSSNIVVQIGEQELVISGSSSNFVYNEITEIAAP